MSFFAQTSVADSYMRTDGRTSDRCHDCEGRLTLIPAPCNVSIVFVCVICTYLYIFCASVTKLNACSQSECVENSAQ